MTHQKDTRSALVQALREWMKDKGLTAFVIPSSDPHQGEYVPERFRSRARISGFDGSAGTVVITPDHAGLWTDSRYFLAAETALAGSEFVLHRVNTPNTRDYPQWLAEELSPGSTVGVDGRLVTRAWHAAIRDILGDRRIKLVSTEDPFDSIWEDRPVLPSAPVVPLAETITGESARERIERIRERLREEKARSHVISTLDDIAWTLNLRGSDVEFNPVFIAYLVIGAETGGAVPSAVLYTDRDRITDQARAALETAEVTIRPYEHFTADLEGLPEPVLLDPDRTSWAVTTTLGDRAIYGRPQPSTAMKARKNDTEVRNLKKAIRRDGVAIVRFLSWLDRAVAAGTVLDEFTLAAELQKQRSGDPAYVSDSFSYISGLDANGAIVHYTTSRESAAALEAPAVYLIDSGAQYRDGTTDITRTVALDPTGGDALAERFPTVRTDYTLVLKGHIALARLVFPENKPGRDIDVVARLPLWNHRRNYGHGTGHGVGFFLNVHEGPQKIAPGASDYPLEEGMLCSNEPGIYRTGKYGIRTENLILVRPADGSAEGHAREDDAREDDAPEDDARDEPIREGQETEFGRFFRFETLSLCPIDCRLLRPELLTDGELDWLNRYHRRVYDALAEFLNEEDRAWLTAATAPVTR